MKIAPEAKLDDGQFDVISIGDLGGRPDYDKRAAHLYRNASQHAASESHTSEESAGAPGESREHRYSRY